MTKLSRIILSFVGGFLLGSGARLLWDGDYNDGWVHLVFSAAIFFCVFYLDRND
jgi:hypothetical protein